MPSQLLLDLLELRPMAITPRPPFDDEPASTGALTEEDKAEELEGLRFAEPTLRVSGYRAAAKLDQGGSF
jgi:hypothetical protein